MRNIVNILILIASLLMTVESSAQSYYVYGDLRNQEEKQLSIHLMLVDTIVSEENIHKATKEWIDVLGNETDYRKTIGSLSRICEFCQKINDTATVNYTIRTIDSLGKAHKDRNANIQTFILRAKTYQLADNESKELEMLTKGSLLAEKINNQNALAEIFLQLSKTYERIKDTYNCTKYLLDAIKLAEERRDLELMGDVYIYAADFFLKTNECQQALAYITAANQLFSIINNHEKLGKSYILNGYVNIHNRHYIDALQYLKQGIDLLKATQNKHWMARAYSGAGYIGEQIGRKDFAQKNYLKSLSIRKSLGIESEIAESFISYSEFLLHINGNNDTIINYLEKAYVIVDKYQQMSQMIRIYSNLANVYAKKGDFQKAFQYANYIITIKKQERFSQDPDKIRAIMEFNSDLDKETTTRLIQESSNEQIAKQGNEILILTIGISIIIILLLIIITALNNRTKQNKRLLEQKTLIQEKSLELQIKNMELERTSLIARHTNNGIAIVSSMYVIEWLNQGIVKQFNVNGSVEQYLHKPVRKIIGEELIKHFELCFKQDTGVSFEIKRDGNKYFQVTLTPYTNQVGRKQIIVITTDISELKSVEEEIEKKKRELEMQADMMVIINSELAAQKAAISEQNEQLEFKNREITESLEYARKIQDAIQPMQVFLDAVLKEYFVINFPRDIVSGDFHWFDYRDGNTYIALADCTGHGIPGAVMSMLGTVTLSNIISSGKTTNAAQVLDQLRSKIIKLLHQRGIFGEAQDGMDISLCVYNEEKRSLHYAGAYSYTYLARFGTPDEETIAAVEKSNSRIILSEDGNSYLICFKADRMPIGIHTKDNIPFRDVKLHVNPDDIIYMTSDGFCDQFGGEKNKKFNSSNFEKLLLSVIPLTINKQKEIISKTFIDWKGINEQVDDVHVIGVKL